VMASLGEDPNSRKLDRRWPELDYLDGPHDTSFQALVADCHETCRPVRDGVCASIGQLSLVQVD